MKSVKRNFVLGLAVIISACSWRQTPVPLTGDASTIQQLVGSWTGEYTSASTGRSGSVTFDLASERDTAFGDIVMLSKTNGVQAVGPDRGAIISALPHVIPEPLKIRFVRAASGQLFGTLDPYKDPDCGCRLITTFQGTFISPDRIEGTFYSRGTEPGHTPAEGRWRVTRQARAKNQR